MEEIKLTSRNEENTQRRYAKVARVLLILFILLYVAAVSLMSAAAGSGDFAETAHNLIARENLYRAGLGIALLQQLLTIWLAISLYVTLKPVNGNLALAGLILRGGEAIVASTVLIFGFISLQLHLKATDTSVLGIAQLAALAEVSDKTGGDLSSIAAIFYGTGCAVFFYLFLKSGYLPRLLSVWGLFASALVPLVGFANLIMPQYSQIIIYGWLPMPVALMLTELWLLIRGIKLSSPLLSA